MAGLGTKHRAIVVASVAFAEQGVAATSLDDLARRLGVTKQAILYHFGSKQQLVAEVLAAAAGDLAEVLGRARLASRPGWPRVEAVVRQVFALGLARPELLALLRELNRMSPEATAPVRHALQPLVDAAVADLSAGMADGRFRPSDPRMVLVAAYGAVTGAVVDTVALGAVGLELDVRMAARLRRAVLDFLRAALVG
ncbi:MAG: TetR/AcrR family transcriptional regulator [Acidimicrobiales bacterium]